MSSVIRRLQSAVTCLGASALAFALVACSSGGSSSSTTTSTPTLTASALKGQYVFTANGTDPTDGLFDVAGVLTFDGVGKVTAGVADYNLGSGIDDNVQLTGTYTVASSTALVTLTDGQGTQDSFTVNVGGSGALPLSAFDGLGSGTLTAQAATSFATAGTYTYSLSGQGENALTSTGGFVVAANTITSGTETDTDGTVVMSYPNITGLLDPVQTDGRGQAAIGGYTFSYYPVTANQIVLVGLDDRSLVYGTATKM